MKVLAVDDDPIILELLQEFFLLIGGHQLLSTTSPSQAIEIAADHPDLDCFLLDIQMPDIDGITLCKALRSAPMFALTPILMITAMSDKRYIDAAFAAGATDYVTKPFEISELRGRIHLLEALVQSRRAGLVATQAAYPGQDDQDDTQPVALHAPFPIRDVPGVVDALALENYLSKLSRSALFGSSVFALAIRQIGDYHAAMSAYDFKSMIVDVSEALSDCLGRHQALISYLGSGTFAVVTEGGWVPDLSQLLGQLHGRLRAMELYTSDGKQLDVRLCYGKSQRLIWRGGRGAVDALAEAHESAEEAVTRAQSDLGEVWYMERTA